MACLILFKWKCYAHTSMGTGAEEMNQPLRADLEKPAALTAVMGRATPSFKEQESFKT